MRPLWECEAHRVGRKPDQLDVFMDVTVNPADQRRIRAAIERETRETVAREIQARQMFYTEDSAPTVTQKALNLVAANYMAEAVRIALRGAR